MGGPQSTGTSGTEAESAARQAARRPASASSERARIAAANGIFAPSEGEVENARTIVAAFEQPENAGKGAINLNGRMVERLHAEMAKRTLALAEAIGESGP